MEDDLLVAKNSTVLPHCPRKIKYVKNILNITLDKKQKTKKTKKQVSLWLKEKFSFTTIQGYIYPNVKHPGQRTVTTASDARFLLGSFSRFLLKLV